MSKATKEDRDALLEEIWMANAKAIAAILKVTPPDELQAATLNAIVKFLKDNDVTSATLIREHERMVIPGLAEQVAAIKREAETEDPDSLPTREANAEPLPPPSWPARLED